MQTHISKFAEKYQIPNLCVVIKNTDLESTFQEFWARGTESGELKDFSQIYPVYSITKTYIAVLILKLYEQGKFFLEDPIETILKDAPEGHRYSIRQVLNHTSGLPEYTSLECYDRAVKKNPSKPWSQKEFIQYTFQGGLLSEPGEKWAYSNFGYMLLKKIIEKITNSPFEEALRSYIFSPLHLKDSYVFTQKSDFLKAIPGYSRIFSLANAPQDIRDQYHPGWISHGLIATTAKECIVFFQALFSGKLLQPHTFQEMLQSVRVPGEHPPSITPSYALGMMADPDSICGPWFGHGGGGPGYTVQLSHWCEIHKGTTIAAFGNSDECKMLELTYELAQFIK